MSLLWTNPSSNTQFVAQTLNIDFSMYNMVLLIFKWTAEQNYTGSTIIPKGYGGYVGAPYNWQTRFQRLITSFTDTSIVFGNGILGTSVDETKCIPMYIYGIQNAPAMIYTGAELIEGDGIKINNGIISAKGYTAGNGINIEDGKISTNKWKTFIGNAGSENYLPINWNELSEISFRVLGSDAATFGYVHIPKELWHNDGAYILEVNCINEYGNFKGAMWFEVIGKHSNSTQIKATVKSSAQSGFTIAYR